MEKYETTEEAVDHHGRCLLVVSLLETTSARDQNTLYMGLLLVMWKCMSLYE